MSTVSLSELQRLLAGCQRTESRLKKEMFWGDHPYLVDDPDGNIIEVSWWDGSEMFPIEGLFSKDLLPLSGSKLTLNVVWCGSSVFLEEDAKSLRFLGTLEHE